MYKHVCTQRNFYIDRSRSISISIAVSISIFIDVYIYAHDICCMIPLYVRSDLEGFFVVLQENAVVLCDHKRADNTLPRHSAALPALGFRV